MRSSCKQLGTARCRTGWRHSAAALLVSSSRSRPLASCVVCNASGAVRVVPSCSHQAHPAAAAFGTSLWQCQQAEVSGYCQLMQPITLLFAVRPGAAVKPIGFTTGCSMHAPIRMSGSSSRQQACVDVCYVGSPCSMYQECQLGPSLGLQASTQWVGGGHLRARPLHTMEPPVGVSHPGAVCCGPWAAQLQGLLAGGHV